MKKLDTDKLKNYLHARNDIVAAYIFGSRCTDRYTSESDIDVAFLMDEQIDNKEYGLIKQDLITALIELLSFDKIDAVVLNAAVPLLCHQVIKHGILLFSKDERQRIAFTSNASRRYLDTIHLRRVQDKVLHEKIRSGDFGNFKGSHKYSIKKIRKGHSDTSTVKQGPLR